MLLQEIIEDMILDFEEQMVDENYNQEVIDRSILEVRDFLDHEDYGKVDVDILILIILGRLSREHGEDYEREYEQDLIYIVDVEPIPAGYDDDGPEDEGYETGEDLEDLDH